MEELLNKLIEKGWKPFGYNEGKYSYNNLEINDEKKKMYMVFNSGTSGRFVLEFSLREICSLESGLWQFVCENKLTTLQIEYNNRKPPERGIRYHWNKHSNVMQEDERLTKERKRNENYEYRLIESSLKDESELEKFLLDNIKVE